MEGFNIDRGRGMAKVFVVHDTGALNFTSALDYGELVPVVTGKIPVSETVESMAKRVDAAFKEATEGDYLLLIGNPVLIGLACTAFIRKTGVGRFLVWDQQEKRYMVKTGNLPQYRGGVVRVVPDVEETSTHRMR